MAWDECMNLHRVCLSDESTRFDVCRWKVKVKSWWNVKTQTQIKGEKGTKKGRIPSTDENKSTNSAKCMERQLWKWICRWNWKQSEKGNLNGNVVDENGMGGWEKSTFLFLVSVYVYMCFLVCCCFFSLLLSLSCLLLLPSPLQARVCVVGTEFQRERKEKRRGSLSLSKREKVKRLWEEKETWKEKQETA